MSTLFRLSPSICLALLTGLAATGAAADGACHIPAWSDPDVPGEPPVHAAPSADSPVLGHAPRPGPNSDIAGFGADFTVTALRDGWARIADVADPDSGRAGPDGWIDARLVTFVAQTQVAFAAPDPAAPPVWTGDQWPVTGALLECRGAWALLRFTPVTLVEGDWVAGAPVTGWVRGICGNQWTTCDGLNGDWAKDLAKDQAKD
ncbi:MAG: hypothetical protein R3D85_15830 [Paracoccaceae bacterium]